MKNRAREGVVHVVVGSMNRGLDLAADTGCGVVRAMM